METEGPEDPLVDGSVRVITIKDLEASHKTLGVLTSLLLSGSEANLSLQSLQLWTKNSSTMFLSPMDDRVVLFFNYLGTFLGFKPPFLLDPQTFQPSWRIMRMRLIPDLIDKITSYDHRKKISVPYTYSYGYIKEKCDLHTLLDSTSFPSCFPVLELLSMWFSRALSARERAVEYHSSRQGEELEFIEEIKKVDGEIDDDDDL